jgi:hypothetical protein
MLHQFQALRSDVKQHETGKTGSASDDKPFHNIGEVALQKTHKGFFWRDRKAHFCFTVLPLYWFAKCFRKSFARKPQ